MRHPDAPTVTVYTMPGCQPCRLTVKALIRYWVSATIIDLPLNPEAQARVSALGYREAPVVTVTAPDGELIEHWSGYRPDRLAALRPWFDPAILDRMADAEQSRREDLMAG